jgi:hypothetical protein
MEISSRPPFTDERDLKVIQIQIWLLRVKTILSLCQWLSA